MSDSLYPPITIYNTLNRGKELLQPLEPGLVKLYVCGITAYDYCHIGHARSALVFDMVAKYLRYRGYRVIFIRNFTDIDDKIIQRAQEQGVDPSLLAQRFINEFYQDMDALGIDRPDAEPRATEYIPEMIQLIGELMAKGMAYAVAGDVYFRVREFPEYGLLSGRSLEDMQAGARVEVNENKEHPMDFALWKGAKPGEPQWHSPWGPGRPGWHIECSAMSKRHLGEVFDIHGGGKDLVFPHHENEIAQSRGATGKDFAKIWMHHGFVTIRDEKMSKSLGNFLTIRDVLAIHDPEVLRLFVFSAHYRSPLDFSESALADAQSALERVYSCLSRLEALPQRGEGGAGSIAAADSARLLSLADRFHEAMDNDFNSAQALGYIFDAVKLINNLLNHLPQMPAETDGVILRQGASLIRRLGGVLGLFGKASFQAKARQDALSLAVLGIDEEQILALLEQRRQARANKDWKRSDAIRDDLLRQGISIQDSPQGTAWELSRAHHAPESRKP